jgi:AraC-like DNA-binding protein
VIEADAAGLYGPELGRSHRRLEGNGWAVGALLQPGVARLLVAGPMRALIGGAVPLDELRVADAAASRATCAPPPRPATTRQPSRSSRRGSPPSRSCVDDDARLVRRVVELAEHDRSILRAEDLARASGLGLRTLQRLVREQLGLTPKWLIRRYRMQEAAAALAAPDAPSLADLAAELGFADQAHLTREFRAVIGETPRRYALAAASAAASVDAPGEPTSRRAPRA